MGDKFDGALAGGGRSTGNTELSLPETLQSLALHETLVAEDESGALILLRAVQNLYYGGIMVVAENKDMTSESMKTAIKLSQMTSMLNDEDRCSKYAKAIFSVLQTHPKSCVIDIGTGTGLLACLAARAGARSVYAVEMFQPMAELARQVIRDNKLEDKVTVYAAKSTDLTVQETNDAPMSIVEKADILVTEIFDSALLGEACLPVIQHAQDKLLASNSKVIPARAVLYGRVVQSRLCAQFQDLGPQFPFHRSKTGSECLGGSIGIPLHVQGLCGQSDFDFLSEKFTAFKFNFTSRQLLQSCDQNRSMSVPRIKKGTAHAVLTWWELDLTGNGEVVYSTEPGVENWQDHWLPVIYPICSRGRTEPAEDSIPLSMGHDQMSFWFAYGREHTSPPVCSCGFHALQGGPYRIAELGNQARSQSLQKRVESAVYTACKSVATSTDSAERVRCIDISDSSVCALLASRVSSDIPVEVLSVEEDSEISAFLYEQVAKSQVCNKLENIHIENNPLQAVLHREHSLQSQSGWQGFNVVLSEPYTRAMQSYPLSTLGNLIIQRNALSEFLAPGFTMVPKIAEIKAQAIIFAPKTLQQSFGAVEEVLGLDHKAFAQLYDSWPGEQRLSLPLFQYKSQAACEPVVLKTIDLCTLDSDEILNNSIAIMKLHGPSPPDAIKLWAEYDNEPPIHVARYEIALLSDEIKQQAKSGGHLFANCSFNTETGSFNTSFTTANPTGLTQ